MEEENKYYFMDESGEQKEMEAIFSFYSKKADKNYVFVTDDTYDEVGELNVYAYYKAPDQTLLPVTDADELDTVNKIVEKYQESKIEEEKTEPEALEADYSER